MCTVWPASPPSRHVTGHDDDVHHVIAECWLLGLHDGHLAIVDGPGGAYSPTWTVDVPADTSPMDTLAACAPTALRTAPHSTSWRFADGRIVLSFVAAPTRAVTDGLRRIDPQQPGGPGGESPTGITHESVVRHALRHVAFLMATDPAALAIDDPDWRAAGREHIPTVFRDLTDGAAC